MNIKETLSKRINKEELKIIVNYYLANPHEIDDLMSCYFINEGKLDQWAAWIIPYIAKKNSKIIRPYYKKMLKYIEGDVHTGVIRNTMRIFEDVEIPENLEGNLYEKCVDYILNPKLPVAVPAFSISVGTKICLKYPELKEEFIEVLRTLDQSKSAAIRVRIRRASKALMKS